jgi:SAM-dependent methyltransferase
MTWSPAEDRKAADHRRRPYAPAVTATQALERGSGSRLASQPGERKSFSVEKKAELFMNLCPICGSDQSPRPLCKALLAGDDCFDLVECGACRVRYLNPLPTQQQLAAFYAPQYYGSDWYKQLGRGMAFASQELKRLPAGRFLDVGCGLGYFIEGIRRHSGWHVSGVEFSSAAVAHARGRLQLDVREGELVECGFPARSFDYVHVNNVLEHVRDPRGFLKECRRLLRPGGMFYLSVPNGVVDSRNLLEFERRQRRPGRSKDGHLFFFPGTTMLELLDQAGFQVARTHTYGIRRGLRILGLYPRGGKWQRDYESRPSILGTSEQQGRVVLPAGKNRPDWYYLYRHHESQLKRLPGLQKYGLDFLIYSS